MMKNWIMLAIIVCHRQQLYLAEDATSRFFKVDCLASKLSVKSNFCFVKAYSRDLTTLNFGILLKRELTNFYCKYNIDYKYGSYYRNFLQVDKLDWCSFINGEIKNVVHSMLIDTMKQSAPDFFHPCPYKGDIKVYNMTLDLDKFKFMLPAGIYRTKVVIFDDYDSEIVKMTVHNTVRSTI